MSVTGHLWRGSQLSNAAQRDKIKAPEQLLMSQRRTLISTDHPTNWLHPPMLIWIRVYNPDKWHCLPDSVCPNTTLFDRKTPCDPCHVIGYITWTALCYVAPFSKQRAFAFPGGVKTADWTCSERGKSCRCPEVKHINGNLQRETMPQSANNADQHAKGAPASRRKWRNCSLVRRL